VQFALLHAAGGQGKSRLALEVCRKAIERHGMQAGFLSRDVAPRNGWDQWRPSVPTLMVIDYAWGRADEVRRILRGLTLPGPAPAQTIRILLLDREGGLAEAYSRGSNLRAYQSWIDTLTGGDAHEVERIHAAFAFEKALKTVGEPWELMEAVFRARGAVPPDRDLALSTLQLVDPNASPLFAILVADALAEGVIPQEGDRYAFLLHMIHRENLLPRDRILRENVLNLVAVATLTRGLDSAQLAPLFHQLAAENLLAPRFRPRDDDMEIVIDAAAELTGRRDGTWLYGLEPDLLGETLVLSRCDKGDANADRRIDTLRELAWRAAKPGQDGLLLTGELLYLMARDFPTRIVGSGLLRPPRSLEPAVVGSRAATLAAIAKVFDRHVSLDAALSFYSKLRDEADAPEASEAIREWRAIAAGSLTLSILFRDLERHLGLDNLMQQDFPLATGGEVTGFFPAENRLKARAFFNNELRDPAERIDALSGVLEERGLIAATLMNEFIQDDDLENHLQFYRSEIARPLERSNATRRMQQARANIAAVLIQKLNTAIDLDAALAFYETELKQPAEQPDAPEEVREERAIVAAGLDKGSAHWLSISLGIERAKARFSLIAAIAAERGLGAAIVFYDTDLRRPAKKSAAMDTEKEARAAAATCLLHEFVVAERFADALDFYEKELRGPALTPDTALGCRTWRAIAAFNLLAEGADLETLDFYDHELRRPALQLDAPPALDEWRAKAAFNLVHNLVDIDELDLALRFCISELVKPASTTGDGASSHVRISLDRASELFDRKAHALEQDGIADIATVLRYAAKHFRSITSRPLLGVEVTIYPKEFQRSARYPID
jgi:hypothetical protein